MVAVDVITRTLTALRNELVAEGIVRAPATAGPLPPAHVEPGDDEPPAPGDREAPEDDGLLVITLRLGSTVADDPAAMAWRRRLAVDVIYRSRTNRGLIAGRRVDAAIAARLTGPDTYGLGLHLDADGPYSTHVVQATTYGGIGPVSVDAGIRTERASYLLEVLLP